MSKSPRPITIGIELIDDPAWIGGTLYLRNLAICLSRLPAREQPVVRLIGAPQVISNFLAEWGHLPIFKSAAETLPSKILWHLGMTSKVSNPVDVVYPGFGAPIPGAVTIRWIPDFQHRYLPHLFSADEIAARDQSISEIAAQPGVVVLSSEVAADDFKRFYPSHLATPRVWHFYSLLDTTNPASLSTIQKYGLPEKYLYLPNQFWTHKNHITVLKALAQLRNEYGSIIPLVCTGAQSDRRNEAHFASLQKFIEYENLASQIHFLGLIERSEQVDVLRHAAAIVQPSLFEGWSTVVEDVRATGRPIFLSNLPVHREQAPERCTYFAPESEADLASKLAYQWPGLQQGPDYVSERQACDALENSILGSAYTFLNIASNALAVHKA